MNRQALAAYRDLLSDPDVRREYEESRLFEEAATNIDGLLESLSISRGELASRLGVSAGRVSQMLSGGTNLTLRTLASMAWALGFEVDLRVRPLDDRTGTPAVGDPPAPDWVFAMLSEPTETMVRADSPISVEPWAETFTPPSHRPSREVRAGRQLVAVPDPDPDSDSMAA